ncbi:16S rRNA (guanine(527)-N(7))-methyltransferase RsmG [Mycoplasma procyoni]|uniref:16S rRNA (guanine(527)-N(7))-methyltransferase RsmG n=1 Tax=Mycoplasma procyoni TaxID=568784 RepID=UPI00197C8575|nr:16S rRNA (guanine(527)-N(7))-methyltransferase RsmG [Mycoplasma procyoni]MBN3535083.1 16S rRNA (guanine(527)-N(7))-methyltransferase RsmG [Mycoplasma procyoni]
MTSFKEKTRQIVNNEQAFLKLEKYVELIEEKNKHMNLTGFSGDKLWEEGIFESIVFLQNQFQKEGLINKNIELLDVGAGAGFPSVPYAIINENVNLTIYEPMQKRVDFLNIVKAELNLKMNAFKIRAEESKEKEKFDFVCARAVMDLRKLIEVTHFLAKKGSVFSFLKGPKVFEEQKEASWIMSELKIDPKIEKINTQNDKDNYSFSFSKTDKTPEVFPRKWEKILKNIH